MSSTTYNPTESAGGAPVTIPPLLPGDRREAQVFWRLRRRILETLARQSLQSARLRVSVLLAVTAIFWLGLYFLFQEGFDLLRSVMAHPGMRARTVHVVFNIFFLALTIMSTISAAVILYGSLFRSEETAFLLTTPARSERIVLHKFQEAVFFSCWGFLLLGSPMLIAYGMSVDAPWYYYYLLGPFVLSFALIPTSIGAIACLLVVYYLPALRMHALTLAAVALVAAAVFTGWTVLGGQQHDLMTHHWFADVFSRLQFSEQRLLPNWWLSSGLLESAHPYEPPDGLPSWIDSLLFLAVLTANALILQIILTVTAARLFRPGYSRLQGIVQPKRRPRAGWIDRAVLWLGAPLPAPVRMLIVKDVRLFRRDAMQWTQLLAFFGVLALYMLNVRRFDYGAPMGQWITMIGFLNVGVVGLFLSTFTTRFIYPMISLEGRRLWILGASPLSRDTILWAKFTFACAGSLPVCTLLVVLSDFTLQIAAREPVIMALHVATSWLLCIALSALAVGLGARLPNLQETSPAKIAAGFGGTLNLVLGMMVIVVVVMSTAVPAYFWLSDHPAAESLPRAAWWIESLGLGTPQTVAAGACIAIVVSAVATFVPLRVGLRAFRKLEM